MSNIHFLKRILKNTETDIFIINKEDLNKNNYSFDKLFNIILISKEYTKEEFKNLIINEKLKYPFEFKKRINLLIKFYGIYEILRLIHEKYNKTRKKEIKIICIYLLSYFYKNKNKTKLKEMIKLTYFSFMDTMFSIATNLVKPFTELYINHCYN